uniref:Anaphase-promoting complex subunit 4 WD40 domain-containing protein n=1 Tax=Zooxanthella nutricula TaxID=1333877 RepID=A0A6U6WAJ8_9DINO
MSFDPKGARMVTGGTDGSVRYFDFHGMSEAKEPFRVLEPVDGHMVQSLSFNATGAIVLVVCSDSHARIYDRDGSSRPIQSTVKGDLYVRDMQHTKGHTQMLTDGMWHPLVPEHWITSSIDGTVRIWDLKATPVGMDQVLPSVHVLKTVDKRNVCTGGAAGRTGGLYPCCCMYSPDAKMIAGGCSDGSVQVFFDKARYMRPDRILRSAHTAAVTSVAFLSRGSDSQLMVTRSLDSTMKIWDCRMLSDAKGPVKSFEDLPCGHEKAGVCTSPDGRYIVAGASPGKGAAAPATVRVYDSLDFALAKSLDFGAKAPLRFCWPKELNQLVVSTSVGEVTMLYSPFSSKKGALHFVGKKAKRASEQQGGFAGQGPIFNMSDPTDIKKFWATGHGNMQSIRRQEARQSQKTLTPIRPGQGDKNAGSSDQMAFAALVLKSGAKQLHLQNTTGQEKDSQKALLAYADKAEKNPVFVDQAYSKTQPTKLLDWSVDESEGDKRMSAKMSGDFCRKCGQKQCRCIDYSVWGSKKRKTS